MPEIRPRQLSTVPNPMPFSSRIPVHLLSASSSLRHQVRCYTSDIKHPPAQQGEQETPASEQIAFQSLGSLFRQPLGGPYSRVRMAEENAQRNVSEQSGGTGTTEDSATTKDNSTTFRSSWWDAKSASASDVVGRSSPSSSNSTLDTELNGNRGQQQSESDRRGTDTSAARQTQGRLRIRRHLCAESDSYHIKPSGRYSSRRARVPNPFGPSPQESKRPASLVKASGHSQWGMQAEAMDTIDSFSDPSAALTRPSPKSTKSRTRKGALPTSRSKSPASTTPSLTHLSPSGSARMVDVASKPATLRIAIAHALVRFSHPIPHQLISTSTNAKGDVLAVARIAGIMAAKRTADLIPLCHPLPLTKIDMTVTPHAPTTTDPDAPRLWPAEDNLHGAVALTARVECLGPTGVEMEALTAVSAAALTVYDMCKAVDQAIVIDSAKLLYKSGGRRGVYLRTDAVGSEWLAKNGLTGEERMGEASGDVQSSD
nr:cyclic pyranopterin monophosphate synthase [Quercus suber]